MEIVRDSDALLFPIAEASEILPASFATQARQRALGSFWEERTCDSLAAWYEAYLEKPLVQALQHKLLDWPELQPTQSSAVTHLVSGIDLLGQLRDAGLCVYARGEIKSQDILHLKSLTTGYLTRERLFLSMSDDLLRQKVMEIKADLEDQGSRMEDFLRKLKAGYAKGLIADTAMPVWFQTFAGHLGYLHETLIQTCQRYISETRDEARSPESTMSLEGDIEWQLASLSALPLFRGLPDKTLRALLRGARLIDVEKNQSFITQGEPLNRLYIIIDGWVKTLKASDEGEESILQIATKREAIVDNGTLSSTIAAFSAKAVTSCRLLSIPLTNLRDQAMRQPELAQNLLAITTGRLQKLVAQYEQITLRSAADRVGWFLVNLYLETGLEGAPLALPFEKSLIAAYLNIKPETFSRALQDFRKKGFKIEKDRIVMPHPQALCSYCDPDMALRCCRAEAVDCAPIRIAKKADAK